MSAPRHRRVWVVVIATLLLVGSLSGPLIASTAVASPAKWTGAKFLESKAWLMDMPDMAASPAGHVVLAYGRYRRLANMHAQDSRSGRVVVRVKPRRSDRFGSPTFRGPAGSHFAKIEVTPSGEIILLWQQRGGTLFASFGRFGKPWSKPTRILGLQPVDGYFLSTGPDGTAAIMAGGGSGAPTHTGDLYVATRAPNQPFGEFQRITEPGYDLGGRSAISAGVDGHATAVWTARCPLGVPLADIADTQFADVSPGSLSSPIDIPGFKCPLFDVELAQDRNGVQYYKSGGFENEFGVRVASRMPNGNFSAAQTMESGNYLVGRSILSVSATGFATVLWDVQRQAAIWRTGYQFSRAWNGGLFSQPRLIKPNPYSWYTYLGDVSTRPSGSVDGIWIDGKRSVIAFSRGRPGTPVIGPSFRKKIQAPLDCLPDMKVLDGQSPRYFAWWSLQRVSRNCEIRGIEWVNGR